tara:strand:+ start:244 stop:570 length:327 start_codon:yes stop_codon:yes gene_type:complete
MALAQKIAALEATIAPTTKAEFKAQIDALNEISKDCAAMIIEIKDAAQLEGLGQWADADRITMPSTKAYQAIETNGHSDLTKLEIRGIMKFKSWNMKVSTFPRFSWFK